MPKLSDRERILRLLETEGSVDTFRLRREGYSGNPSQRIRELKAAGHQIATERIVRADGRAGARYILVKEPQMTLPMG